MSNPRIPRKLARRNVQRSAQLYEGPDLAGHALPNSSSPGAPALTVMPGFRTLAQDPFLPSIMPQTPSESVPEEDEGGARLPTFGVGSLPEEDYTTSSPIRFDFDGIDRIDKRYWAEKYASKKARQWARWTNGVIPSLLRPYLDYLAGSAQGNSQPARPPCVCGSPTRRLEVVAVYWESMYRCSPLSPVY